MIRRLPLLALAALAALAWLLPAVPAAAAVRTASRPNLTVGVPPTPPTGGPGGTVRTKVWLIDGGTAPIEVVSVLATNATPGPNGKARLAGSSPFPIRLDASLPIHLAAGREAVLSASIAIPRDAPLGIVPVGLVVRSAPIPDALSHVSTVLQVGALLSVQVGGAFDGKLDLSVGSGFVLGDGTSVPVRVCDPAPTGSRASLTVYAKPTLESTHIVWPHSCWTVATRVSPPWWGGPVHLSAATLWPRSRASNVSAQASSTTWFITWWDVGLAGALVAAVVSWAWRRRRRRTAAHRAPRRTYPLVRP